MTKRNRGSLKDARRAVADFVDANLPRFNGWLNQIAGGIPQVDRNGEPIRNLEGSIVYLVKPDPLAALKVVADITEYHLPKLSRQDVSVSGVIANLDVDSLTAYDLTQMSLADLKQLALQRFQQAAQHGDVIDVEVEPLPSWLNGSSSA